MVINHSLQHELSTHMQAMITSGAEEGMQLCVYQHGQCIVDIAVGTKNDAGDTLDHDDLVLTWSVSKGITATAMHLLAERRLIDYDDPIARFWPEFAQNGKAGLTIRHMLTHTAGISDMPASTTAELADWDFMCNRIAAMVPKTIPGVVPAYHPYSFGWGLGEVLRRVDGRPLAQFVQDEICRPLGITHMHFGPPADQLARAARLSHNVPADKLINRDDPANEGNDPVYQRATIPAANLMSSARALARFYASLIGDGVDGVRLLPPHRVTQATTVQRLGIDQTLWYSVAMGLGYWLGGTNNLMPPRLTTFGHPGAGGAIAYADPEYDVAIGFTKTRMHALIHSHDTSRTLVKIISKHLGMVEM